MPTKWSVEELAPGRTVEAIFWPNPTEGSQFKLRATHLDGRRAPKVVLSNDDRITPGIPCLVRIAEKSDQTPVHTPSVPLDEDLKSIDISIPDPLDFNRIRVKLRLNNDRTLRHSAEIQFIFQQRFECRHYRVTN